MADAAHTAGVQMVEVAGHTYRVQIPIDPRTPCGSWKITRLRKNGSDGREIHGHGWLGFKVISAAIAKAGG